MNARRKTKRIILVWVLAALGGLAFAAVSAERLPLRVMIQRVLTTYPQLQVARLQVERARQEQARVEAQLGWNLNAQAGANRDLDFIGSPTNRSDASVGVDKKFSGGGTVGMSGGYTRQKSDIAFSPAAPNPYETTSVDLTLRQPLVQGLGNPAYTQGLISAQADLELALSQHNGLRENVVQQAIDLFHAAALTQAEIANARRGIDRAQRLKKYVQDNARLGLSEAKDLLQAEAQLQARLSDLSRLKVAWERQRSELNLLMTRDWDAEFIPEPENDEAVPDDLDELYQEAEENNPELQRYYAQLKRAEADIRRRKDAYKDKFDVVLSVGNRKFIGDTDFFGTVRNDEVVGGVRVEYRRALDKQGFEAELTQAQLDRSIALQEINRVQRDLRHKLAGLVAEIRAAREALRSFYIRRKREQRKFEESLRLYRAGRLETDRLINFENDVHLSRFLYEQQRIELSRKIASLELVRGGYWRMTARSGGGGTP